MIILNVFLCRVVRRSRRILSGIFLTGLFVLTACTDYVGQIDDQIDEFNVCERAREESKILIANYYVDPSSVFKGEFEDPRDNHVYKTVTIGAQTWMAENLNYKTDGSYCYNDDEKYCKKYGRLYTWAAAMDSAGKWSDHGKGCGNGKICAPAYPVKGVCPKLWHLPSSGDWSTLLAAFGLYGGYVSCGSEKYGDCTFVTEDTYGFSIRFGGARADDGTYYSEGTHTYFWLSTESSNNHALIYSLISDYGVNVAGDFEKNSGLSVRCVKDKTEKKPISSSSIEMKPRSSSSVDVSSVPCEKFDLWCKNSTYHVDNTGMEPPEGRTILYDDLSHWWVEDDHDVGGHSDVEWPVAMGGEQTNLVFDSIIDYCKGLCGKVKLVKGDHYSNPFVEIGFDIPHAPVDVSDWDGICITYMVSKPASLVLHFDSDKEDSIFSDVPTVSLPKASVATEKCFTWSEFKQTSLESKEKISGEKAAKILRGIALKIQASDETTAEFNIIRLRKVNPDGKATLVSVYGTLVDPRDGITYKTVKIASQTWMAENLKYKVQGSYCLETPEDCEKYGRYYTWAIAMDSVGKFSKNGKGCGYNTICKPTYPVRGICPEGWHLPRESEFARLVDIVGGEMDDEMLKSTSGWQYHEFDKSGNDTYGFNVLPAGYFSGDEMNHNSIGDMARFWTSDGEDDMEFSKEFYLTAESCTPNVTNCRCSRKNGLSIRCVKN